MTKDEALIRLQKSSFRAGFHLGPKECAYIEEKGWPTIERHTAELIAKRLAPAWIPNDGRQTPMRGHPVFVAQHACACCCRGCLEKWYRVRKGQELTPTQQKKIVQFLLYWMRQDYEKQKKDRDC